MTQGHERADETFAPALARFVLAGWVALLLFVGLLAWGQYRRDALFNYPADQAYTDIAVARQWAQVGAPAAGVDRIPLPINSLWQALLSACSRTGVNLVAMPFILSLVIGLLSITAVLSFAGAIRPRASFLWWTVGAWPLIGPIALDGFTGQSFVLATVFSAFALCAHLNGLRPGDRALPLSAAFWLGLAVLLRVEFFALWLAFGIHALLLALARRVQTGFFAVLVRWINGAILMAIALCPVIWWNMRVLGVPWPPSANAALTLNAVGGSTAIASSVLSGLNLAASALWHGPLLGDAVVRIFVLAAIVVLLVDVFRKQLDWSATTLLLGLFLPFVFAPFYPFLGGDGLGYLCRAIAPLWLLLAGYAAMRAVDGVEFIFDRAKLPLPRSLVMGCAVFLLGAMPILAGLRDQIHGWRAYCAAQRAAIEMRSRLAARMESAVAATTPLASDAPGWLLYRGYTSVLDLQGRLQPVLLSWINGDALRDEAGLRAYLAQRGVQNAVFWESPNSALSPLFDCPPSAPDAPYLCHLK